MATDPTTTPTPARNPSGSPAVLLTDTKVAAIKPPAIGQDEHRDLKVTGLRLRIGVSGKKTWIVRARAGDKILNKKLGIYPAMSLSSARGAAEKLLETVAKTGDAAAVDRTFGEVASLWVDKVKLKNTSWRLQERRLEMHVLPKWQTKKIATIRRSDVRDLLDGLEGDTLPNSVLKTIRTVFRFALSRDWIDASPAEGIEKPNAEVSRDHFLTMEEVARVWRATELLGFPFTHYVRVLLLTGQRRTEVASMRWDQLDLDAGTWTLASDETKSNRAHLVPLSPSVVAILKAMPRFKVEPGKPDFVFTTDGATHLSGYAKLKAKLDKFIAAGGDEPMRDWRFHDLRRTAATHLVRLGVLEEVVSKVLNHASQGVTAKVYALHRYEPEKRSALDRWAAEVDRAVNGKAEGKVVKLHG